MIGSERLRSCPDSRPSMSNSSALAVSHPWGKVMGLAGQPAILERLGARIIEKTIPVIDFAPMLTREFQQRRVQLMKLFQQFVAGFCVLLFCAFLLSAQDGATLYKKSCA